jgi:hypothetical protein
LKEKGFNIEHNKSFIKLEVGPFTWPHPFYVSTSISKEEIVDLTTKHDNEKMRKYIGNIELS